MKPSSVKYSEAVLRNIASLNKQISAGEEGFQSELCKHSLETLKTRTGIKKTDGTHDTFLQTVIKQAQERKEKAVKKAKNEAKSAEVVEQASAPGPYSKKNTDRFKRPGK